MDAVITAEPTSGTGTGTGTAIDHHSGPLLRAAPLRTTPSALAVQYILQGSTVDTLRQIDAWETKLKLILLLEGHVWE